jgi:hypothetical protein
MGWLSMSLFVLVSPFFIVTDIWTRKNKNVHYNMMSELEVQTCRHIHTCTYKRMCVSSWWGQQHSHECSTLDSIPSLSIPIYITTMYFPTVLADILTLLRWLQMYFLSKSFPTKMLIFINSPTKSTHSDHRNLLRFTTSTKWVAGKSINRLWHGSDSW